MNNQQKRYHIIWHQKTNYGIPKDFLKNTNVNLILQRNKMSEPKQVCSSTVTTVYLFYTDRNKSTMTAQNNVNESTSQKYQ